jgi:hypothetical protein
MSWTATPTIWLLEVRKRSRGPIVDVPDLFGCQCLTFARVSSATSGLSRKAKETVAVEMPKLVGDMT